MGGGHVRDQPGTRSEADSRSNPVVAAGKAAEHAGSIRIIPGFTEDVILHTYNGVGGQDDFARRAGNGMSFLHRDPPNELLGVLTGFPDLRRHGGTLNVSKASR